MASKTITGADGKTKKVLVGSVADPSSKTYIAPTPVKSTPSAALTNLSVANAKNKPVTTPATFKTGNDINAGYSAALASKGTPNVINSTNIKPVTTPVSNIQPSPALGSVGLQGEIQSQTDAYTQAQTDAKKKTEAAKNTDSTAIRDFISQLQGESGLTDQAYSQKGGVDKIQTELDDINQKILNEQVGLQRKIEVLEKNAQGRLEGGLNDQINDVERESIRKQADLSIIQMGIQGRYDSAKDVADRAVDAYLEKQDLQLKALEFNYNESKDLFTKAEQREFETMQANRQNALDAEKAEKKEVYDLAIQAQRDGAPTSVVERMMSSSTKEQAAALGGSYIGSLDREAKRANIAQSYSSIATNKLQQQKLLQELNPTGDTEVSADLEAYGNEFAATGKLPAPSALKAAGITAGQVADYAKQVPKSNGVLVSKNTGAVDTRIGAAEQDDIKRLYNITQMVTELETLDKNRIGGLVSGTLGKLTGSDAQGSYLTKRKAIVDEIARMQTGAALTNDEQDFYNEYLPGRFSEPLGFGRNSDKVIQDFGKIMNDKLTNVLANNQMSIYGYSKTKVPSLGEKTVGEILEIGGTKYRVLPDGTLTDII